MKHIQVAVLIAIYSITTHTWAQSIPGSTRKYIEQARVDWGVPGMAVAIVKENKVIFNEGFGTKKKGSELAVDSNTQFAIASNTKAFVSSALAVLVADGQLSWDDQVVDILPYFELYDRYSTSETTIRDLLCHRVGLGTFSGDVIWYKSQLEAAEVIKKIKHLPPAYAFRSGYGYSNLMFITAGEVIKAVTGKNWNEYVKETFFEPLGMNKSITSIDNLDADNAATPHKSAEGNLPISWVNWDNMGAAGGIISTTTDMAQWMMMNLNDGIWNGTEVLPRDQQRILWTPHNNFVITEASEARIPGRHFTGYGLGWGLYDYFGRMVVTHSGGYDGMYSRVMMVPDEQLGIVILTNSMSGITLPLCLKLLNDFIKEDRRDWSQEFLESDVDGDDRISKIQSTRLKDTSSTLDIAAYAGSYEAPLHGGIKIEISNAELTLSFDNAPDLSASLKHWHLDTWEIDWDQTHAWFDFGLVTFELNSLAEVTGLKFNVPNGDIFFDELVVTKVD